MKDNDEVINTEEMYKDTLNEILDIIHRVDWMADGMGEPAPFSGENTVSERDLEEERKQKLYLQSKGFRRIRELLEHKTHLKDLNLNSK